MQRINGMRYKSARKVIAEINAELDAWQEHERQQRKIGREPHEDARRVIRDLTRRRDNLLMLQPETLVCIDV